MAFVLIPDGPNRFTAQPGKIFTLNVTADRGTVSVRAMRYNGLTIVNPGPYTFTAVADSHSVGIVYVATDPDAEITIVEVDGAKTQDLAIRGSGAGAETTVVIWVNRA